MHIIYNLFVYINFIRIIINFFNINKYINIYIIHYILFHYKIIYILIFFFIGRKWPIITGAGFGLGMAYANCQEDLNSAIRQQQKRDCNKVDEGKKNS